MDPLKGKPDGESQKELKEEIYHPPADPATYKKHWPKNLIFIVAFILLGLFLLGFFPRYFQKQELDDGADLVEIPSAVVMKIKSDMKPVELTLPSSLEAWHVTPIWARTNGYLKRFLVDIGDHVKEGQLMAEIDTPDVDQELEQARANLAASIARLEIAQISAKRWEDLYKKNAEAVPLQEVDERRATLHAAEADVLSNEANVHRLEYLEGFKNIYAPFNGIITQRSIDIGSLISAGSNGNPQQLFVIAEIDTLRAFVDVPQNYFRSIKDGLETKVLVREFPDKVFKGKVSRNAEALDPLARTLRTQVNVDNRDEQLISGIYAQVVFKLIPEVPYYVVPTDAVIIRASTPKIAIVNDQQIVHLQQVQLGRDWGKTIEITEGLNESDTIIVNPTDRIRDGSKVKIIKTVEDKN